MNYKCNGNFKPQIFPEPDRNLRNGLFAWRPLRNFSFHFCFMWINFSLNHYMDSDVKGERAKAIISIKDNLEGQKLN